MKTAPGIDLKLRAARTKLKAFKRNAQAFIDRKPYEVLAKGYTAVEEPSLYQAVFSFAELKRPPSSRWALWIDEITYHLRSALDTAVYDLSRTPKRVDPSGTYFPIVDDRAKFKCDGIRYLTKDQRTFIEGVQPYGRPDDPLWLLHEINRLNKHRIMQFGAVLVAPDQEDPSNNLHVRFSDLELLNATFKPVHWAEDGTEIARLTYRIVGPNPSVHVEMNNQIEIKFAEPSPTSTWHVGLLMERILETVERTISTLYSSRP